MKNKMFSILLILIFVAGLSLLLYPMISNTYNDWLHKNTIVQYSQQVQQMEQAAFEEQIQKATDFNNRLNQRQNPYELPEDMQAEYDQLLDLSNNGIMGYIEIPSIDVTLPIAHGADQNVLQRYIGHLEWSSLPVGGENTHCVISGHRGLPSSELFTNIDHLELGDRFFIHILGQTLEYQVCHIAVVEPSDQKLLRVEEGRDLITLVTCTPYGINSHRLLVRGIRKGTQDGDVDTDVFVKNEVTGIDPVILVVAILVVIAVATFVFVLLSTKKTRKEAPKNEMQNP